MNCYVNSGSVHAYWVMRVGKYLSFVSSTEYSVLQGTLYNREKPTVIRFQVPSTFSSRSSFYLIMDSVTVFSPFHYICFVFSTVLIFLCQSTSSMPRKAIKHQIHILPNNSHSINRYQAKANRNSSESKQTLVDHLETQSHSISEGVEGGGSADRLSSCALFP